MTTELPLFPLNTVLFPGGQLTLRVFEQRYRRLVDLCGRQQPFVVVRILAGREVGEAAFCREVGTTARITLMQAQADGSLGIRVEGLARVRLGNPRVEADNLMFAEATALPPDMLLGVPADLQALATALNNEGINVDDAASLVWRLAEVLPLPDDLRQQLLEENAVALRLQALQQWLDGHADTMLA